MEKRLPSRILCQPSLYRKLDINMLFQWYTSHIFVWLVCDVCDKTLGKICYCFPLMSSHGIIKISEFFRILIADNSLITEYVSWYRHPAVQLDLWGLTQVLGPLSFVYSGCEQRSQAETLISSYLPLPPLLAEKVYCKEEQQSDWKIAVLKKMCNIMQNPTIYMIYIWIYVCIYMNICIYFIWLYISDFWVDIFLCTHNMHFTKCVYTPLSLNPYTSTLCSCCSSHGRDCGLHFTDGEVQSLHLVCSEQGWTQIFKALRHV